MAMPKMTVTERMDAQQALLDVQETQSAYWSALGTLERLTGLDLDGTRDYECLTLEELENQ